jgi:hypothetical protein
VETAASENLTGRASAAHPDSEQGTEATPIAQRKPSDTAQGRTAASASTDLHDAALGSATELAKSELAEQSKSFAGLLRALERQCQTVTRLSDIICFLKMKSEFLSRV